MVQARQADQAEKERVETMMTEDEAVQKIRDDMERKQKQELEIQEDIIEGLVRPLIRQGLVDDVDPGGGS